MPLYIRGAEREFSVGNSCRFSNMFWTRYSITQFTAGMALQKYMKRLKSQKEQWILFDDNHVQKPTATRGHKIPPILPAELAILIVRTEVGYIYISVK